MSSFRGSKGPRVYRESFRWNSPGEGPILPERGERGVHGSHIRGLIKGALYMRGNFGIEIAQQLLIGIYQID